MRTAKAIVCAGALLVGLVSGAAAQDEFSIKLKPGAGVETTQTQCAACHSLDYIQSNAPFMSGKVWEAEVNKMIKTFGAPIEPKDARTIIDYLSHAYGG